jgi:DNA-binding NarL/FixJ family response regulator
VIICAVKNLLFSQQIRQICQQLNHELISTIDPKRITEAALSARLFIIDLNLTQGDPFELLRLVQDISPQLKTVAFVSHVEKELIERAQSQGVGMVLPRSKFFQVLPEIVGSAVVVSNSAEPVSSKQNL